MLRLTVRDGVLNRVPKNLAGPAGVPKLAALALALILALTACAPGAFGGADPSDPAVAELQRAAEIIYHRMELGKLELGAYTTTPLVDARIPEGATLTLVEYDAESGSSYTLMLTSSRFTDGAWRITPRGVSRVAAG